MVAPFLDTDRNVLEAGAGGRQPAGHRAGLIKSGVQPVGAMIQQRGQRIHISALQLGELAIIQHQARHLVLS